MKIKVTKKDIIWSYLGMIMSLCGNFIILPFMLYFLDDDMYGMWNAFVSLGAIVTLFDFGFNATFARNITFCWSGAKALYKEKVEYTTDSSVDYALIKKLLKTCQLIYFVISAVALILLISVGSIYVSHIGRKINSNEHLVAWMFYGIAIFLNLYYGYYDSFLRGVGAITSINRIKVFSRLVQIVLSILLLFLGFGIVGASIAYFIYGFVFRFSAKHAFYAYQGIGDELKKVNIKIKRSEILEMFHVVWHNAWRDGLVSLANYLSNQATVVIASMFLSLSETGAYSLAVQLSQAIVMIASTLYSLYQPTLQSAYVFRNNEKIKNTMSAILCSYFTTVIVGFFALIVFGLPLIRILKPTAAVTTSVICGVGLYQMILKGRNCYTTYLSSTNRVIYAKAFVVSGVICVALSLVFEEYFNLGIWGLIIAQIISQLIYNAWKWPLIVHKELKLNVLEVFPRGYTEIKAMVLKK